MALLILAFLLLLANHLSAQSYQNISLGTTLTPLTPPTSWLSPSRDFAFGFRPLETNSTLFLLSVWYNKIPNKTVVWTANGDNPIADGSKAVLTSSGELSLKDPTGQEIWNAHVSKASYASMLDTGNFVLSNSESVIIWQSFDHPTDTILPGQVLNQGATIYARLLDTDYSQGRFELTLQDDGNLVLYPVAYPTALHYDPYWSSQTFGSGITLVFNESGSIYLSFRNKSQFSVLSTKILTDNYYQRAVLDPDGVFRQYAIPKDKLSIGNWELEGNVASNICDLVFVHTGSGACGFNSYCTLDPGGLPDCVCPPYYSLIDPIRKYKGCKPDFITQRCEAGGETLFKLTEMDKVDWPLSDAEEFSPMNVNECKDNCLKDCFCSVAIYNNETCWKKKFPLSNGRKGGEILRQAFIKYSEYNNTCVPILPVSADGRSWKTWVLVESVILGTLVALNLVQVSACFLYRRKWRSRSLSSSNSTGPALCSFTYKELVEATDGFKEELGRGAFGIVYKGVVASQGKTLVAVKKLEGIREEAEKDFDNEVKTIGQTHHKHLVRLIGFCKEEKHRLLVYEFMSNGSLSKFLFGSDCPDWPRRVQIALGIAGGLAYLHEECRTQIIHCDIKPQNILLDENLVARISDFGLAKLLKLDQTRTSTGIRGTIGYFAPEWFKKVAITAKVDVYSFGVMLLEIICCRRNFLGVQSQVTLMEWAKECYRNGKLDLLVEEDEDAKKDGLVLERFVMVAMSCIQDEPWLRPSMKKVVQMLEGAIAVSVPPNMYSINL